MQLPLLTVKMAAESHVTICAVLLERAVILAHLTFGTHLTGLKSTF